MNLKASLFSAASEQGVRGRCGVARRIAALAAVLAFWGATGQAQVPPWQQTPGRAEPRSSEQLNWLPGRPSQAPEATANRGAGVRVLAPPVRKASHSSEATIVSEAPVPDASAFAAEPMPATPGPRIIQGGPGPVGPGPFLEPGNMDEPWACDGGEFWGTPVFGFRQAPLWRLFHDRVWVRSEYLMWWTKGAGVPPLLTTSSDAVHDIANAGVLGLPTTFILLGEHGMNRDMRSGGRLDFGIWFDPCRNFGLEFSYLGLGQNVEHFDANSDTTPILARPFLNVTTGLEDSHVIAFPDQRTGTFSAVSTSELNGAEVLFRKSLARCPDYRIDLLAGYRFLRLDDSLRMSESFTDLVAETGLDIVDQFNTRNDFNGGEIGFLIQRRWCRWSLESTVKLALGSTHSRVVIAGSTAQYPDDHVGMLALASNRGTHEDNRLAMVPEIGINLGYDLTPRLRATFGYTFMYWSTVARPGDQIDLNVDPNGFAPVLADVKRPQFQLHTTDFWAQGLNFGLDFRF